MNRRNWILLVSGVVAGVGLMNYLNTGQEMSSKRGGGDENLSYNQVKGEIIYPVGVNLALSEKNFEKNEQEMDRIKDEEDKPLETDNLCNRRCVDAGRLSKSLLVELCGMDISQEEAFKTPLYNRLMTIFILHPKADEKINEVEIELRGNVNCADQVSWGGDAHKALLQLGILDEPLSAEMEIMLNNS